MGLGLWGGPMGLRLWGSPIGLGCLNEAGVTYKVALWGRELWGWAEHSRAGPWVPPTGAVGQAVGHDPMSPPAPPAPRIPWGHGCGRGSGCPRGWC